MHLPLLHPQLLAALHYATQGRLGKQNTLRLAHRRCMFGSTEQRYPRGQHGRRAAGVKRVRPAGAPPRGCEGDRADGSGHADKTDVEAADDLESLKRIIFDEFNSLLASLWPDQTVPLCRSLMLRVAAAAAAAATAGTSSRANGDSWIAAPR